MRRNDEEVGNPAGDNMHVEHHSPRHFLPEIIRAGLLITGTALPRSNFFPAGTMYSGVKAAESTVMEIAENRKCTPLAALKTVETVSFCTASFCCIFGSKSAAIAAAAAGEAVHTFAEARPHAQMQRMGR